MHEYTAEIHWEDRENTFATGKYSRVHTWTFDGGARVEASSSPAVVRPPYSSEEAVDPEEAFVASVSSCHMLTFLYFAYREKYIIKKYADAAIGYMEKDEAGREWISRIELKPRIDFEGIHPTPEALAALHDKAHHGCYIANSIRTAVSVLP